MNLCRPCGEDFSSVGSFDAHRVGEHDYTLHEGLKMEPPREDGRRCLTVDEMEEAGWDKDKHGRWRAPGHPGDEGPADRSRFEPVVL